MIALQWLDYVLVTTIAIVGLQFATYKIWSGVLYKHWFVGIRKVEGSESLVISRAKEFRRKGDRKWKLWNYPGLWGYPGRKLAWRYVIK